MTFQNDAFQGENFVSHLKNIPPTVRLYIKNILGSSGNMWFCFRYRFLTANNCVLSVFRILRKLTMFIIAMFHWRFCSFCVRCVHARACPACSGDRDSEPQNAKLPSLTWRLSRRLSMHSERSWWYENHWAVLSLPTQASRSEHFVELVAAVQSTAEAARQANINKSENVSWTTIENDQVEAALQAEASSLREELGERKHQVKGMDCLYCWYWCCRSDSEWLA